MWLLADLPVSYQEFVSRHSVGQFFAVGFADFGLVVVAAAVAWPITISSRFQSYAVYYLQPRSLLESGVFFAGLQLPESPQ